MRFVITVPKEVYVIYYVFISPELLTHDSSSFYPLWLDQRQMKISEERHVMLTESSVLKRDAYTLEKPELNLKRPTHHQKAPLAGAVVGRPNSWVRYSLSVARMTDAWRTSVT